MEHVRTKPVSDTSAFFQAIVGFAVAALVMLGVGGTVYRLVAPGGWLAQLFGRSLAGGMAAMLAFLIIGLCAWLARSWISVGARNRHSDLFVYGFALAGACYAIEIFHKGGF
jgi:protein-S-isoprenylcysteine O-methyltransferase Ste14